MGRYGHLTGKIMGLKIHPSKVVEFLYLLSHGEFAAHIKDRTKLLVNSACKTASISLFWAFKSVPGVS